MECYILTPYQGRHPTGPLVTSVREESDRIGGRAPFPAIDLSDAERREPLPRKRRQIALPSTLGVSLESRLDGPWRPRVARRTGQKGLSNLVAHLEVRGSDGGAEPSDEIRGCPRHRRDRRLEHSGREASPPGMGGTQHPTVTTRKKHRQAIGHLDGEHDARGARHDRIRPRPRSALGAGTLIDLDDIFSVNLIEPHRLRRQTQRMGESTSIFEYGR
jgi:hypothetical protein